MRRFILWMLVPVLFTPACAPLGSSRVGGGPTETIVRDPPATAPPAAAPTPALAPDPKQEEFETRILPILVRRCSPCHFVGGKMYDRLPFDQPGTIRVLGTALFTRLRDEEERQVIRDFIGLKGEPNPAEEVPE